MKINLSVRMKMNASLVSEGAKVADIGCDHGYVAMWLATQKNCPVVIASDIGEGPLNVARRNISSAKLSDRIDIRLGDGLSVLEPGEVDTIVIAGMGGMLMCEILSAGKSVTDVTQTLVLQPQSDIEALRRHIHKMGYRIDKESICLDDGKYYFSIRAVRGTEEIPYTDTEYRHSRLLAEEAGSVYRGYIRKIIDKYISIVKNISDMSPDSISSETIAREEQLLTELENLRKR